MKFRLACVTQSSLKMGKKNQKFFICVAWFYKHDEMVSYVL